MTRRQLVVASLAATSTLLLVTAACGPGFLDGLTGGDGDAAPSTLDAAEGGPQCVPARPPEPPDAADLSSVPELYFAFEELKLDTQPPLDGGLAPPTSYDLDGLCSCHGSPAACAPVNATVAACDSENGRDDALAAMFNTLLAAVPQASTDFATRRIQSGSFTVLLHLRNWNGTDDDPNVLVTVYGSQGLDPSGGNTRPAFDGTDTWTIDPRSLFSGSEKIGLDCRNNQSFCSPAAGRVAGTVPGTAYVKNGELVAHFGSAPLVLGTNVGDLAFDIDAPSLVARIGKDAKGAYRLTGQVFGQWPVDRALPAIGALTFPTTDASLSPLCANNDFYKIVKQVVCEQADLPAPDAAPTSTCHALSAAAAFTAGLAAHPSVVYQRNDGGGPCAAFRDDCTQ